MQLSLPTIAVQTSSWNPQRAAPPERGRAPLRRIAAR
jgi:hypothetical protein